MVLRGFCALRMLEVKIFFLLLFYRVEGEMMNRRAKLFSFCFFREPEIFE